MGHTLSQQRKPDHRAPHRPIGRAQAATHEPATVGQLAALETRANASPNVHQLKVLRDTLNPAPREAATPAPNRTGMPDRLKSGLEGLSGFDLSDVRVHYNSSKPAQLNAHAYTQGKDIHVAPGQERHVPHEGWHAVQQMQGRVRATTQLRSTPINDETHLEREADVMGAWALRSGGGSVLIQRATAPGRIVQRVFRFENVFDEEIQYNDIKTMLQDTDNAQLAALRAAPNVEVVFNLDDENDLIPGDTAEYQVDTGTGHYQDLSDAVITIHNGRVRVDRVRILVNVRRWVANRYDLGTAVSIFLHELGAHVLPYADTVIGLTGEEGVPTATFNNLNVDTEAQDHLDTQDEGNPAFAAYQQLAQDTAGQFRTLGLDDQATSMLNAYLMDLASLDEEGNRIFVPTDLGGIADRRNELRGGMDWMAGFGVQAEIGRGTVLGKYAGLYLRSIPTLLTRFGQEHPVLATSALAGLLGAGLAYAFGLPEGIENLFGGDGGEE